jgi:hypothetical protein
MSVVKKVDGWIGDHLGLSLLVVLALVFGSALVGAAVGLVFPKYEADALLQAPQPSKAPELQNNVIDLAMFRRVFASYASTSQLSTYLEARKMQQDTAAARLLAVSDEPGFWSRTVAPVLPFSRRDQREFGELKDAASTTLLGVDLLADARSAELAASMVQLLGQYFGDAIVRERIRDWVSDGRSIATGSTDLLRAEMVRSELDIALLERRVAEMKSVLGRYPEAMRLEARQVVSVSPAEGGERFLSPLAQLVSFESAISQRRELIARTERDIRQRDLLASFYVPAYSLVAATPTLENLLPALHALADTKFKSADLGQEWAREAKLRVEGAIANFGALRGQYSIRNEMRVGPVLLRTPWRMAALLTVGSLIALAALGFVRTSVRLARGSGPREQA